MVVCGYLVYLLSTTLEGGLDIRLILPGAVLIFTLLQGCGYWLYRDQAASGKSVNRTTVLRIFSLLKRVTPFVIGLYPLFLLVLLFADRGALFVPFNLFGLILLFFSIAEYVNYYYFSMNTVSYTHIDVYNRQGPTVNTAYPRQTPHSGTSLGNSALL